MLHDIQERTNRLFAWAIHQDGPEAAFPLYCASPKLISACMVAMIVTYLRPLHIIR